MNVLAISRRYKNRTFQTSIINKMSDQNKKFGEDCTTEVIMYKKRKENWRTINQLRDSLRCHTPFIGTLGGLTASAITLSFFGMRDEVCQMLQKLNHASRAYIVQQRGLPGFVKYYPLNVVEWLEDQKANTKLPEKLQKIKVLSDQTPIAGMTWADFKVKAMVSNPFNEDWYVSTFTLRSRIQ